MINAINITKRFAERTAIYKLDGSIPDGSIFGIVGCNGAGKSTLMRLLAGVYKADEGMITIDGEPVYDNAAIKKRLVYVPDELYLPQQSTMDSMADLYSVSYAGFDRKRFAQISADLGLKTSAHIGTYSKGMRRQVVLALALSCMTGYILLDETFDGLDPVIRRYFKDLLYLDSVDRRITTVITSHSLRELEDTCDHIAMLHNGSFAFSCEVNDVKTDLFKLQLAFHEPCRDLSFEDLDVLHCTLCGSVMSLIVRGDQKDARQKIKEREPVLLEILPLSLEEIFVYEMQERGYVIGSMAVKEKKAHEKATV